MKTALLVVSRLAPVLLGAALVTSCGKSGGETSAPGGSGAAPAGAVSVLPVVITEDSGATGAVRDECQLDSKIPDFVQAYSKGSAQYVTAPPASGRVLNMQIVHMLGGAGGAHTGPKQITLEGTLTENGAVIGSFKGRRTTTGGAYGGFKGTCSLLGRCAKALGKDVAVWLNSPTMDARLGEY